MMTRWEYEALRGLHGEKARREAQKSWGRFLGAQMILAGLATLCSCAGAGVLIYALFRGAGG
jgi:hypothetical protein